ncbi:MAG: hypothetical protein Q4B67_05755 [Eubacteriales bacterium]|nr:hypothetical protein [Eubacteriales bacterium]
MRYSSQRRNKESKLTEVLYFALAAAGLLFLALYIYKATADVVWSDYIRLINEYIPEVGKFSKLFVPDVLTRTPLTYAARLINVRSFSYSVTFDRILTLIGIAMITGTIVEYSIRYRIKPWWYLMFMIIIFSLNKWEIIINGTAWPHMVAIGLFFINYSLFDKIWTGEASALTELTACVMPFALLLVAGEYIASYAVTMIIVSFFGSIIGGAVNKVSKRTQSIFLRICICTAVALLIYLISRHFAVWEHAGTTDITIFEIMKKVPTYLPKFFLKTLAGSVIGQETAVRFGISDIALYMIGAGLLVTYVLSFVWFLKTEMGERTIFPMLLLISGFMNHLIITYARWSFLSESYAMSSRYGGQFMIGLLGIAIMAALYKKPVRMYRRREANRLDKVVRIFICLTCVMIVAGMIVTTADEIVKAKYRKQNFVHMQEVMVNYENYTEEELCKTFEWHKDPAVLYNAIEILKKNRLNVFAP